MPMRHTPPTRTPTLAQRALELASLNLPDARIWIDQGRQLRYWFSMAPSAYSRVYRCLLGVARSGPPEMRVVEPDLRVLAANRALPHVYRTDDTGTKLCLWLPRRREWCPQMRLAETYLPWTAQWLDYFEEWLWTGEWAGGGEHPRSKLKRWGTNERF